MLKYTFTPILSTFLLRLTAGLLINLALLHPILGELLTHDNRIAKPTIHLSVQILAAISQLLPLMKLPVHFSCSYYMVELVSSHLYIAVAMANCAVFI